MSTDHRAEALRLVNGVLNAPEFPCLGEGGEGVIAAAQVHATLAVGQDTAADISSYRHAIHTYRFALIRQIAEGLALSKGDEAHLHARGLAQYLDSVGLNVDREVDAYVEERCGIPAREAWKPPSTRYPDLSEPPF